MRAYRDVNYVKTSQQCGAAAQSGLISTNEMVVSRNGGTPKWINWLVYKGNSD